jgi:hypothetical protein
MIRSDDAERAAELLLLRAAAARDVRDDCTATLICPESNSLPEAPRLILLVFQSKTSKFPIRNCSSPHL